MIKIIFYKKLNNYIGFEVRGHSNSIIKEQEIVCAAVSSLTQSTIIGIKNYLEIPFEYKAKSGYLNFKLAPRIPLDSVQVSNVNTLFATLNLSLINIDKNYQGHISIKEKKQRA